MNGTHQQGPKHQSKFTPAVRRLMIGGAVVAVVAIICSGCGGVWGGGRVAPDPKPTKAKPSPTLVSAPGGGILGVQ